MGMRLQVGEWRMGFNWGDQRILIMSNICRIFYDVSAHQHHVMQHEPHPKSLRFLQRKLSQPMISVLLEHIFESIQGRDSLVISIMYNS